MNQELQPSFLTITLHRDLLMEYTPQEQQNLYSTTKQIFKDSYSYLLQNQRIFGREELQVLKKNIEENLDNIKIDINEMIYIQLRFLENALYNGLIDGVQFYEKQGEIDENKVLLSGKALNKFYQFKEHVQLNENMNFDETNFLFSLLIGSRQLLGRIFSEEVSQEDKNKITQLYGDTCADIAFSYLDKFEGFNKEVFEEINREFEEELKKQLEDVKKESENK